MAEDAVPTSTPAFERALNFGRFSLDPARKLLLEEGRAVRLGSRALALLVALVERAGDVVSHDDLIARVWPRTVVEESSLRVHMSALRKALGDGVGDVRYIASLPGRGYRFEMAVIEARTDTAPASAPDVATPGVSASSTPARLTGIVGREQVLDALAGKLHQRRFVTIVGTGGIGKTTVARALVDRIAHRHAHGACFVDLASLDDPAQVPGALAAALGIAVPQPSPWSALEAALAPRDLLVVLDNCEHVVDAAALLAERVLRAAPRVHVLATSREPLEAESESIHRLEALAVPPAERDLGVDDALQFPALRLFVERATANADDFRLSPSNLAATVRICRHLDGVPLAIELAASRVGGLGIHELAERLDDVFRLLRRGRRTVLPRHQTLQALLDWSHALLDDDERTVLHRLSVFRAPFTLDAAAAVAGCPRLGPARVIACVLDLVARSLVEREAGGAARYRLLFIARLYAWERLAAEGDVDGIARRHAVCVRDALVRANAELDERRASMSDWRAAHAAAMPDVHAALEWANGPTGDAILGVELAVESGRLQLEMGLNDEFMHRALDAAETLRALEAAPPELELRLLTFLCMGLGMTLLDRQVPPDVPARLESLVARIGSPLQRSTALFALCASAHGRGDYPAIIDCAGRFALLRGPGDPDSARGAQTGWRFNAFGLHHMGRHDAAWAQCERVLAHAGPWTADSYAQMPLSVSMGILQARILWLRGLADRALECALATLRDCAGAHALALSQALSMCLLPVLLWRGDDEQAMATLVRLVDHELVLGQSRWLAWCHTHCKALAMRGHDVEALRLRLGDTARSSPPQSDMLATLAPELADPQDLARVEAGLVGWCAPEVLRVHGQRRGSETMLLRSLALARRQGARAWELRAATSLAALWDADGRRREALALLAPALAGFTEGRGCRDVRRAQALLAEWETVS